MKIVRTISMLFFLLVLGVAAVAAVFELRGRQQQQKDTIMIMRGENVLQIADDLKSEGYIKSKIVFLFYAAISGNLKNLKAGEYDLKGLGYAGVIDKMARGDIVERRITIVPGWTVFDIFEYFKKEGLAVEGERKDLFSARDLAGEFNFLSGIPEGADMEGYLFPDTYQVINGATGRDVIRLALANFDSKITSDLRQQMEKQGRTLFEVVVMASILEKEVTSLEDKKLVSGILWKRLRAGMPLQADATLLYSKISEVAVFDKASESRYNTYKYSGLPVGPICNPGLESIEAAFEPLDSDYWFYLSAPDGSTIFSRTYDEHLVNKAKYLDTEK